MKNRTKEEKIDLYLPIICALVYIASYLGRHSYNSNITQIREALGMSYTESGLVTTFFFFAYGAGQFIHGFLCRHYKEKVIIPIVLSVCALINLLVFCGIDFAYYKYLWLINGILLSVLWPLLIRVLAKHLESKSLPKATILMAGSATAGYCCTYLLSAIFAAIGSYQLSFLVATIVLIVVAIVWIVFYSRLGLDKMGVRLNQEKTEQVKAPVTASNITQKSGSLIWLIVCLSVYCIFCNTIKDGLHVWVPSILMSKFELSGSLSTFLSIILSVFGLFASMLSVKMNEKMKNYLIESELLFAFVSILILLIVALLETTYILLTLICLGIVALFMHTACSIMTSIAPLELREKMDSGVLAGVLNGFCYVGSIICSYGLGLIADNFGWNAVFYFLFVLAAIPSVVLLVKCGIKLTRRIIKTK